jgi:hypothetical protein
MKTSKAVLNSINMKGNFPIVQINFAHGTDSLNPYLLSKVNYVDPKLYLEVNKKRAKKISKMILSKVNQFTDLENLKKNISY